MKCETKKEMQNLVRGQLSLRILCVLRVKVNFLKLILAFYFTVYKCEMPQPFDLFEEVSVNFVNSGSAEEYTNDI